MKCSTMAFRPASSSLLLALVGMRSVLTHRSGNEIHDHRRLLATPNFPTMA